jgi:hypothetical protein
MAGALVARRFQKLVARQLVEEAFTNIDFLARDLPATLRDMASTSRAWQAVTPANAFCSTR